MSGIMKTRLKDWYCTLSERFFLAKGDDIKIKRIVSLFFLPLPVYLAFIAVLSLFFARLHGLKAAWKLSEIQVKLISRTKRAFFPRQKLSPKGTI